MQKQIPILILLILLSWARVWSTQPKRPRLLDAGNPSHYHQLVDASIIPELFKGCLLLDSGEPKYFESNPERIYLRRIYIVPFYLSHLEISYRMNVSITFDRDTIVGISELYETWGNYTQRIAEYENNPAVKKFLQVVNPSVINFNGTKFYSDGSTLSRAGFNIDSGKFYFLLFKHDELIKYINLYLPTSDSLAWIGEFQSKLGIGRLYFENGKLSISQSRICPVCSSNVLYNYSNSYMMKVNLSTDQTWEHFPEVRHALQVVENQIATNTLKPCKTEPGYKLVFIRMTHYFPDDIWRAKVAIKCRGSSIPKEVSIRFQADSTID